MPSKPRLAAVALAGLFIALIAFLRSRQPGAPNTATSPSFESDGPKRSRKGGATKGSTRQQRERGRGDGAHGTSPRGNVAHPSPVDSERRADPTASEDEARAYLGGMRRALYAYKMIYGALREAAPCPAGEPDGTPMAWEGPCTEDWKDVGWQPGSAGEGGAQPMALCQYAIEQYEEVEGAVAVARCDGDGDGELEEYFITLDADNPMVIE